MHLMKQTLLRHIEETQDKPEKPFSSLTSTAKHGKSGQIESELALHKQLCGRPVQMSAEPVFMVGQFSTVSYHNNKPY